MTSATRLHTHTHTHRGRVCLLAIIENNLIALNIFFYNKPKFHLVKEIKRNIFDTIIFRSTWRDTEIDLFVLLFVWNYRTRLGKVQRSGVQLYERLASLGNHGLPVQDVTPETPRTSQITMVPRGENLDLTRWIFAGPGSRSILPWKPGNALLTERNSPTQATRLSEALES